MQLSGDCDEQRQDVGFLQPAMFSLRIEQTHMCLRRCFPACAAAERDEIYISKHPCVYRVMRVNEKSHVPSKTGSRMSKGIRGRGGEDEGCRLKTFLVA